MTQKKHSIHARPRPKSPRRGNIDSGAKTPDARTLSELLRGGKSFSAGNPSDGGQAPDFAAICRIVFGSSCRPISSPFAAIKTRRLVLTSPCRIDLSPAPIPVFDAEIAEIAPNAADNAYAARNGDVFSDEPNDDIWREIEQTIDRALSLQTPRESEFSAARALAVIRCAGGCGRPWRIAWATRGENEPCRLFVFEFGRSKNATYAERQMLELAQKNAKKPDVRNIDAAFSPDRLRRDCLSQIADWISDCAPQASCGDARCAQSDFLQQICIKSAFLCLLRASRHHDAGDVSAPSRRLPFAQTVERIWRILFPDADTDAPFGELAAPVFGKSFDRRANKALACFEAMFGAYLDGDSAAQTSAPPRNAAPENADAPERALFSIFSQYGITPRENSKRRVFLSLTPEILSAIFEQSLAGNLKNGDSGDRKANESTGSFYTPPEIAELMTDCALRAHLRRILPDLGDAQIGDILCDDAAGLPDSLSETLRAAVRDAIANIKCFDPACGCGAFAVQILRKLAAVSRRLNPDGAMPFDLRLRIAQNAVYAADIQYAPLAVTKLRIILHLLSAIPKHEPIPEASAAFHLHCADALGAPLSEDAGFPDKFDVILCNPPYGIRLSPEKRKEYRKKFCILPAKFDIYLPFFELAFSRARSAICFVTPDKWLSNNYAEKFRETRAMPHLTTLIHIGKSVFFNARVDALIAIFSVDPSDRLTVVAGLSASNRAAPRIIGKSAITAPYRLDGFLLPKRTDGDMFANLPHTLGDYIKARYAMLSMQTAYALKSGIATVRNPDPEKLLKMINTGTIGKFASRWGQKNMRYLKDAYAFPCIPRQTLLEKLGAAQYNDCIAPKIIVKGLNRLDAAIDIAGEYCPAVATIYICAGDLRTLKIVAAILNAPQTFDYLKSVAFSSSWNGALRFTPQMLTGIPAPDLCESEICDKIAQTVDRILQSADPAQTAQIQKELNALVALLYSQPG